MNEEKKNILKELEAAVLNGFQVNNYDDDCEHLDEICERLQIIIDRNQNPQSPFPTQQKQSAQALAREGIKTADMLLEQAQAAKNGFLGLEECTSEVKYKPDGTLHGSCRECPQQATYLLADSKKIYCEAHLPRGARCAYSVAYIVAQNEGKQ